MAVFTKLEKEDFEQVLSLYDIGQLSSFEGINEGIENTNYILRTTQDNYIFTVYEKRVSASDLPFFMSLMENLNESNFPCPLPVHQKTGAIIGKIFSKNYTIVSMLKGKWPRTIGNNEVFKAGEALGKLHSSSSKFSYLTRKNSMGKDFWIETYSKVKDKAENHFDGLRENIKEAFEAINNWPDNLPSGIIHGDYFPDNVLFDNDNVSGVIDFYMSCNDFYAYDLAIALNSWCFERDFSFNITKAGLMLKGYNSQRNLSENELENLNILSVGACLRFLSTRLYDYFNQVEGANVNVKNPKEYLEKLKFHLQVKGHKEYGF